MVLAPAGFGKTTLLTQWLAALPDTWRAAWLTLEPADNEPRRLLAYLLAAIRQVLPAMAADLTSFLEAASEFNLEQGVSYLVTAIGEAEQPLVLILDDCQVLTAPECVRLLQNLVAHLPPMLRLVFAGRVEPPIPLARLRARGELVEVRTDDLRFRPEETSGLLTHFSALPENRTPPALLNRLNTFTEGWAVGLQLTALALRAELAQPGNAEPAGVIQRFVDTLSDSHRYLIDYLLEEVLAHEAPHIHTFLLTTCLLERFNADLCAALGLDDAQETLIYLERANLFLMPLDNRREWYRYHHLFAAVLHKQLLHHSPGRAPELHRRAALWFAAQGFIDDALTHALQTGASLLALDIVAQHALPAILTGQLATVARWLDALPAADLLTHPRLCLDRAWLLTFAAQTEAALPYLERAEALEGATPAMQAEILGLRSYHESLAGHPVEAIRLAQQALALTPAEATFLQCSNRLFLAGALAHTGQLAAALQTYQAAQRFSRQSTDLTGLALLEADFLHDLALFLYGQDAARQARLLLEEAIARLESAPPPPQPAALFLYTGLGKILLMENQLTAAEQMLEKGLRLDPATMSVGAFDGWLALWRVKLNQGDYPAARRILQQLEPTMPARDPKLARMVLTSSSLQDVLEGQFDQAATRLERLGLSGDATTALADVSDSELLGWRLNEGFTYARLLLSQQRYADSLWVLQRLEHAAQAADVRWILYRARLWQAVVCHQSGRLPQALTILDELLAQTSRIEPNPARLYLEPGEPARILLIEARRCGLQPQHVALLLAEFPPESLPYQGAELPEALTARELDVLRLMAEGLKNQEIGARLFITLNTIRYHTSNIFGKLGVDNRTAAVARARELGIM